MRAAPRKRESDVIARRPSMDRSDYGWRATAVGVTTRTPP
jgi:hypothetical protein